MSKLFGAFVIFRIDTFLLAGCLYLLDRHALASPIYSPKLLPTLELSKLFWCVIFVTIVRVDVFFCGLAACICWTVMRLQVQSVRRNYSLHLNCQDCFRAVFAIIVRIDVYSNHCIESESSAFIASLQT